MILATAVMTMAGQVESAQKKNPVWLLGTYPEPREVQSLGGEPFLVAGQALVVTDEQVHPGVAEELARLEAAWRAAGGESLRLLPASQAMQAPLPLNSILVGEFTANAALSRQLFPNWRELQHPEGYTLAVRPNYIALAGASPAGTYYGLKTLRQLLERGPSLRGLLIRDWPELPLRIAYIAGADSLNQRTQALLDMLAESRINAVVSESGAWYSLPQGKEPAQALANYCRTRFIDFIPELQSFGWGHFVLAIDPNTAEGITVENEPLVLPEEGTAWLAHNNVVVTDAAPIGVRSPDGALTYQQGKDYEIVPGVTAGFRPDNPPWGLRRLPGGSISAGQEVRVTYTYAPPDAITYCPEEPCTQQIMRRAITNTMGVLRPTFLHIGHDEPRVVNRDARCRCLGLSNAEIVARDINRLHDYASGAGQRARLMMWEDALNPYHNAPGHRLETAAQMIPKDIVQCVWFYGTTSREVQSNSLKFFTDLGFEVTGSPWADRHYLGNSYDWAQVLAQARRQGNWRVLGIFYTSWDEAWHGLHVAAAYGWNPDAPALEAFYALDRRLYELGLDPWAPPDPGHLARDIAHQASEAGGASVLATDLTDLLQAAKQEIEACRSAWWGYSKDNPLYQDFDPVLALTDQVLQVLSTLTTSDTARTAPDHS